MQRKSFATRLCCFVSFFAVGGCSLVGPRLLADAIWIRSESEPRFGAIIRQTPTDIIFVPFNEQEAKAIAIDRQQIEVLIINIDTQRLENLSPPNWSVYRDYAEELAVQKQDPAARELAIRLYLIAGNGATGELRESCLIGLVALSENDAELNRWRLLQRLTVGEPDHPIEKSSVNENIPESVGRELLNVVQLVRRGQRDEAMKLLNEAELSDRKPETNNLISIDGLKQIVVLNRPTSEQLLLLLRIELAIRKQSNGIPATAETWGVYAQSSASEAVEIPSFKNVTRIDPEESIYRNGQWIRPQQ